jgi:hypothetical protein
MATSNLGRELLRLFGRGDLSGTQVQLLAKAAWDDGWGKDDAFCTRLAHLGAEGRAPGNILRDIRRLATKVCLIDAKTEPYYVDLPDGHGQAMFFLPHEVYPQLVAERGGPAPFCLTAEELMAETGLGKVLRTWSGHRDVRFEGDLGDVAVLGVHADGVAYSSTLRAGASKSLLAASWNIISAPGVKDRNARQPLFVLRKARLCQCGLCGGFHTLQVLYNVLAWSMRCLLEGKTPSLRHDSSEFTAWDKRKRLPPDTQIPRAALLQVRGDREYLATQFRLRMWRSDRFCWLCDCTQYTRGINHIHNLQPDAPHRSTLISHEHVAQADEDTKWNSFNDVPITTAVIIMMA